ncbi:MAG: MFS transporter [Hydrogenophaga sp.]|nr:MFS transporter [Hydrogenophaga sp.]
MHPTPTRQLPSTSLPAPFFGPWVVRAAFVMALLGWGVGFYGPSIFLHAVVQRTGWSLMLVSAAVTVHYLFGALVVTRLPSLHRRFGVGPTAVVGAACTAVGVVGWSLAAQPWQLFFSALLSGAGWVTMGAVAVNAAIAPWYVRARPMALARAYNGASLGGVVFSPLWVLLIAQLGFTAGAGLVGLVMVAVMALLSPTVFTRTPEQLGQRPDGEGLGASAPCPAPLQVRALPGRLLWRNRRFLSLALGMSAGLFAQIGLLAHLFSVLVPALGAQAAGWAMGFATACAIAGRMFVARLLPAGTQRRFVAALAYGVQLAGSIVLLCVDAQQVAWILLGVALFGSGIGNATSLPPLIAQAEFAREDVPRVVALVVAMAQASYAFAPAVFGFVLSAAGAGGPHLGVNTSAFLLTVAAVQVLAIVSFLAGWLTTSRA